MSYLQKQLFQLIAKDKTELALNNLMLIIGSLDKVYPDSKNEAFEIEKELILLNSRFKKNKNLYASGLISSIEENVEHIKINSTLISLIQNISENNKLYEYLSAISSYVELKTVLELDGNFNAISDVLEEYLITMGFNHLEMINSIAIGQAYNTAYTKILYPFLRKINTESDTAYGQEINDISNLANRTFSPGDSMVDNNKLIEWQKASPESWLLFAEGDQIKGFIHVEILKRDISEKIISGEMHEGEISTVDILQYNTATKNDYIHIGSIISAMEESPKQRYKTSLHLLYGIAERIMDINRNTGITKVFAVSYPDWKGNNNAVPIGVVA